MTRVSFEYYMDQFREFGVVQIEMRDDMKIMKGDIEIKKPYRLWKRSFIY